MAANHPGSQNHLNIPDLTNANKRSQSVLYQKPKDSSRLAGLANILKSKLSKQLVDVRMEEANKLDEKEKVNVLAKLFSR